MDILAGRLERFDVALHGFVLMRMIENVKGLDVTRMWTPDPNVDPNAMDPGQALNLLLGAAIEVLAEFSESSKFLFGIH